MAKSDILIELEENYNQIFLLVNSQLFTVGDAERFMKRYYNVIRKMEQLTGSRDNWKTKYMELKHEQA